VTPMAAGGIVGTDASELVAQLSAQDSFMAFPPWAAAEWSMEEAQHFFDSYGEEVPARDAVRYRHWVTGDYSECGSAASTGAGGDATAAAHLGLVGTTLLERELQPALLQPEPEPEPEPTPEPLAGLGQQPDVGSLDSISLAARGTTSCYATGPAHKLIHGSAKPLTNPRAHTRVFCFLWTGGCASFFGNLQKLVRSGKLRYIPAADGLSY
jgi:hypothetical protein